MNYMSFKKYKELEIVKVRKEEIMMRKGFLIEKVELER